MRDLARLGLPATGALPVQRREPLPLRPLPRPFPLPLPGRAGPELPPVLPAATARFNTTTRDVRLAELLLIDPDRLQLQEMTT
jgi:hypothetical protein